MHLVLFNHPVYIIQMATIRTVQFNHIHIGITVITVTLCNS